MKKIRILSLDGGGIRGIIPAMILQYVENHLVEITGNQNARIADYFDFVCGTSTGGILACLYLAPHPEQSADSPLTMYTAQEALDFYSENGYNIFNGSKLNTLMGLRSLIDANKYNPDCIEKLFAEKFGALKMSDLVKPCIVTTYDLMKQSSFFFSSREAESKQRDFYVKDVARSTSAAPTYFPSAKIKNLITGDEMINIDGGVFANNPSICGYAECRDTVFAEVNHPDANQMLILSLGTGGGQFNLSDKQNSNKWGLLKWAESIPDIMMDGSIDTVDYQMTKLFESLEGENRCNYKRIDVPANRRKYAGDMADASAKNIKALKTAGEATLFDARREKENEHTLDKFIELLVENNS